MGMNWQELTTTDLMASVEVLKELPYKNLVIGHKYSSSTPFGKAYYDVSELLGESESLREFDSIQSYREDLDRTFYISDDADEDDDREIVAELLREAEKIGAPFAVYSNGRDEIYTKDGKAAVVESYLSDSMNGHSFYGTKEEAIELIEEQITRSIENGSILPLGKNVSEVVSWVSNNLKPEFEQAKEELNTNSSEGAKEALQAVNKFNGTDAGLNVK